MKIFISSKFICTIATTLVLAVFCNAQKTGPLGLPRLVDPTKSGEITPSAGGKFTEDILNPQGVAEAHAGEKKGAKFLVLDGKKAFSRPLRGSGKDVLFVAFAVYGSPDTVIDVGGAKLSIAESIVSGCAQVMVLNTAGQWQTTGFNVPFDFHGGKVLAQLPVLTLRLDPAAKTFDLYQSATLLAEDIPLQTDKGGHKFTLTAGKEGAWIMGLVQSEENPLYPDANANGLDDRFEYKIKGRLLTPTDTKSDRKELIVEWRADQIAHPAPALFVNLPLPDGD